MKVGLTNNFLARKGTCLLVGIVCFVLGATLLALRPEVVATYYEDSGSLRRSFMDDVAIRGVVKRVERDSVRVRDLFPISHAADEFRPITRVVVEVYEVYKGLVATDEFIVYVLQGDPLAPQMVIGEEVVISAKQRRVRLKGRYFPAGRGGVLVQRGKGFVRQSDNRVFQLGEIRAAAIESNIRELTKRSVLVTIGSIVDVSIVREGEEEFLDYTLKIQSTFWGEARDSVKFRISRRDIQAYANAVPTEPSKEEWLVFLEERGSMLQVVAPPSGLMRLTGKGLQYLGKYPLPLSRSEVREIADRVELE